MNRPRSSSRTAWHPLFVRGLRRSLSGLYFQIHAEWPLSQEPLRQDVVVVRKEDVPPGYAPPFLADLVPLLGEVTLISMKGASDQFDQEDYLHLWACAFLYCRDEQITDPARVHLLAVAPRVTAACREQIRVRGRSLEAHEVPGVSAVRGMDHPLWLVEADASRDALLQLFSRSSLRAVRGLSLHSPEQQAIFRELAAEIRQLTRVREPWLRYPDIEEVKMSLEQYMEALAKELPPDVLLKALPVEERLKGLPVEERLKGLTDEEIWRGLTPEQRARLRRLALGE